MKIISASPKFEKLIVPSICFGWFLFSFIFAVSRSFLIVTVPFIFIAVVMFFYFKNITWDLADEVIDQGNSLLFKKGRLEQEILLKDIISISYTRLFCPERAIIYSRTNGAIGNELAFKLPTNGFKISKKNLVKDLMLRVDNARKT